MCCSVLQLLEEAYGLVQHQVSEGLSALKEECRALTKGLEGTIRSDMDQIVNSKNFLTGKIRGWWSNPLLVQINEPSPWRSTQRGNVLTLCSQGSHIYGFHLSITGWKCPGENICSDQVQTSLLFPTQPCDSYVKSTLYSVS